MITVAIVGRPNVGKSTLFNRLTQNPTAIVENHPGITRDRIYGEVDWNGYTFRIIDTGGLLINPNDVFEKEIKRQVKTAIEEANVILFIVDVLTGITVQDSNIAKLLRKQDTPVVVVVNKTDNEARQLDSHVFHNLGLQELQTISSVNGYGTGDLLDKVVLLFPKQELQEAKEETILPHIAILGQPNVGKSTLTNALLNDQRTLVTDIAGTTRDAIHTEYNLFGKKLILIDTAGLRRKDRSKENVEFYSAIRTVKSLDHADVCMILFDVTQPNLFTAQDLAIFSLAQRKGKGVLLLANKWDRIPAKSNNSSKELQDKIKEKIAPFTDVPILFISALAKQRINKSLDVALDIYARRKDRIPTSQLNKWLGNAVEKYPPPLSKGRSVTIKYVSQLPTPVPSFALFCNHPDGVSTSYKHYLENKLRIAFNLSGIPVRLYFRQK